MKGADVFPSKFLKTADLQGHRVKVKIAFVQKEKMGDEEKPVAYFAGKEKGLVLNVTKWNSIADLYGDESDDWTGKVITLVPGKTTYQGKRVDCIDIYPPEAAGAPTPRLDPQAPAPEAPRQNAPVPNVKDGFDDEIPF